MVSTFAWYQATSAAGLTTTSTNQDLGNLSTTQTRNAGSLQVDFTIDDYGGNESDTTPINVDHTDSTGAVKYLVNGIPTAATTANGFNESNIHKWGRIKISVAWHAGVDDDEEAIKAAGNGAGNTKDYDFTLTPGGMVVLMKAAFNPASDSVAYANAVASLTVKVTVNGDTGAVSMKSGYDQFYYAIRTNNTSGAEDTSSITTANFTAFDTSSAAVPADSMVSNGGHYYITQTSFAQGSSFDTTKCVEAALHSADKVNISNPA